jgi:hypothetical protein
VEVLMIHELSEASIRGVVERLGATEFETLRDPDVFAFRSPFRQVIVAELYGDQPPFTGVRAVASWSLSFGEDRYGEALAILNDWNARKRFGVAYFDKDRDPSIDFYLDLDAGVAHDNLVAFFRRIVRVVGRFDYAVVTRLRSLGKSAN